MPARQISSQSFDEILSDLGDDPAIPDPHGIRKPPPHPSIPSRPSNQSKNSASFMQAFEKSQFQKQLPNLGSIIAIIGIFIILMGVGFLGYNAIYSHAKTSQEDFQKQISDLKKEMAFMRDEFHQEQDELYAAIDEIEVSIHSLEVKRVETRAPNKPLTPNHESELRRWRYLGSTQMGNVYQAYFDTGKSHKTFEKGVQILGEWRLSNIEKGQATLSHTQGKSLVLKASKSE